MLRRQSWSPPRFRPFFWRAGRLDLRNHRKIVVIDACIAYTGSQNLVDASFKPGLTYEELNVRLTGPVALEMQAVFAEDWYVETGEFLGDARYVPDPQVAGQIAVQTLPSGPGYPRQNNQRLIVSLIHAANRRVFITMPYLVPDEGLLQALQTAALRGVEVTLVVPLQIDQYLVGLGQRSYYDELMEAGVRICRYGKRFLHAQRSVCRGRGAALRRTGMRACRQGAGALFTRRRDAEPRGLAGAQAADQGRREPRTVAESAPVIALLSGCRFPPM